MPPVSTWAAPSPRVKVTVVSPRTAVALWLAVS